MTTRPSNILKILRGVVPLFVFLLAWFLIGLVHEPYAQWCTVSYPRQALINEKMPVRVYYRNITVETKLGMDLHWYEKHRRWRGFLSSAELYPTVHGSGEYTFLTRVEGRSDLKFVSIILFLSPTGNWNDRIKAAHTDIIPVRTSKNNRNRNSSRSGNREYSLKTRHAYVLSAQPSTAPDKLNELNKKNRKYRTTAVTTVRLGKHLPAQDGGKWIKFSCYLITSLLCALCAFQYQDRPPSSFQRQQRMVWLLYCIVLIFFGGDSLLGWKHSLTELGREMSKLQGWYGSRKPFQRMMISGMTCFYSALVLQATLGTRKQLRTVRRTHLWLATAGIFFLVGIFVVQLLSFHKIDELLKQPFHVVQSSTILEGIGISCVILSSVLCVRKSVHEIHR
jgi:hypothetical protein